MAKLYFKYGVVNSSKSANALMTVHNYEEQGLKVYILKSNKDTRDYGVLKSRAIGESRKVDVILEPESDVIKVVTYAHKVRNIDVVIVDECQFLTVNQVEGFRNIVDTLNIPVICYGLKTDFRTNLFDSSKRLLELADSVQEIKTVCSCGSKAIFNAKLSKDGKVILGGSQIEIGGNEIYTPLCSKCYHNRLTSYTDAINKDVYKLFLDNKDYLDDLVKRLDKLKPEDKGLLLNEVICAKYFLDKLLKSSDDLLTSKLTEIKSVFDLILDEATPHDILVAYKRG